MYDTTDILDLCQLEADKRRDFKDGSIEDKVPGCFRPVLFCLRNPVFAHKIGSRIKELNQRLEGIHKEAREFNFNIGLGSSNPEQRKLTAAELCSYTTRAQIDESAIVGEQIERDTKELIQVLTTADDNHNIKVVSIIGTGGMGKTTLAQKIFNDATIHEHFKTKIWLSITQHFDGVELLRTAIKHAGGGDHGGEQDVTTLTDALTHTLTSSAASRFLLVMDDVWSERAWNHVLGVPVRNASKKQPGSRVLVTTRSAHLPQQMQAPLHQHRVHPLDDDDAWSLLKKQLQPDQVVGIDEQLKATGMEILEKCDGLPLAIKVVGGLLSTRFPNEHEWKVVLNKPSWSLAGLPAELDSRLYLSYEDLSPQLKQCFLYCSLFPKGEAIIQTLVIHMWASEGFIQPPDGSSSSSSSHEYGLLEDIATEYFQELIKRNLIEPTKECSLTGYNCTMHDVVRSFAEYMAREESLVVVDKEQLVATGGSGGMLAHRLSVAQTVSIVEWAAVLRQERLRTLIINSRVEFKRGDSLGHFSRLRVLCICSADSDRLVTSLSKLKHLRYLHLEDTDVSRLPEDIHEMKFLQYIHLLGCEKLCYLPSNFVKLMHLRSLNISESNVSVVPKGFGRLTSLRFLHGFPVHVDMDDTGSGGWCSLQELALLSHLTDLQLHGLEKVPASWMAEKAMISSKGHLNYLDLKYNSASWHTVGPCGGDEQKQQQQHIVEEVLEKLRPPTCLENLVVQGGYIGCKLPNWMRSPASVDFKSLRYLTLENLLCCTQLPDGLCCLLSLESLIIEDAPAIKCIGPEFQAPAFLAAGASTATWTPFPKLRELQLKGLCEWEEWVWHTCEEQEGVKAVVAMPCLEILTIDNCKLRRLPPGLANSNRLALRELNLYELTNLTSVETFPSVVDLDVFDCPELKRISGLTRLQKMRIFRCRNLEVLEGVPALDSMVLQDATMDTLPEYLAAVYPRYLKLRCGRKLYESLSPGSSEWNKICHIGKHHIYLLHRDED